MSNGRKIFLTDGKELQWHTQGGHHISGAANKLLRAGQENACKRLCRYNFSVHAQVSLQPNRVQPSHSVVTSACSSSRSLT